MKLLAALTIWLAAASCVQSQNAADVAPDPSKICVPPQVVLRKPNSNLAPNSTYQSNAAPPLRFRGDRTVHVQFATPEEVERLCGVTKPICGFRMLACKRGNKLYLPNPCAANSVVEPYGKLLCHELAHANGWPDTHGD